MCRLRILSNIDPNQTNPTNMLTAKAYKDAMPEIVVRAMTVTAMTNTHCIRRI